MKIIVAITLEMSYYIGVRDGVENQPHPVKDQNGENLLRDSNKGRNLGVV